MRRPGGQEVKINLDYYQTYEIQRGDMVAFEFKTILTFELLARLNFKEILVSEDLIWNNLK